MNGFNFGMNPIGFEIDSLKQQLGDIKSKINFDMQNGAGWSGIGNSSSYLDSQGAGWSGIENSSSYQNTFSHSNQSQSRSWVPPKCDDPLVNLVLDIKYQLESNDSVENNCRGSCFKERLCVEFVNEQFITIEAENNTANCDIVIICINKHEACKYKRIIYDVGLLLRAIGISSTRSNINHLIDFLEDLAANSMFFKQPICALMCDLKAFVATI